MSISSKKSNSALPEESYWYNLKKDTVEFGYVAPSSDRIGPFSTFNEAEKALEIVRERSRKWQEEDDEQRQ